MSHKAFAIRVKEDEQPSKRTTIDVEYGDAVAVYKMKELGDLISSLNPNAIVEIEFLIHNSISNTWMVMSSYYADEKRMVKH